MSRKMKLEARRKAILDALQVSGKVKVTELSKELDTTPITIRSDLNALEQEGVLIRVQGGAVAAPAIAGNARSIQSANTKEKKALAERVAGIIKDGDTLFINSGTTMEQVAAALDVHSNISIVTNSLSVATILGEISSFRVILLGGEINSQFGFTHGGDTLAQLNKYTANWAILSVDGINASCGITTCHAEEALIDRTMICNARKTLIVADHTKIGKAGFARVCDNMDNVYVVTDGKDTAELAENKVTVITVE